MNAFLSYLTQKQNRVTRLSPFRWWLSEYLGRGTVACGCGILIGTFMNRSSQGLVGWIVLAIGLLIVLLVSSRSPIIVDLSNK